MQTQKNGNEKSNKLSPYKAKFIADDSNCLKSYALIMNLSANSSFKNRCAQNFVNMINITDDYDFRTILESHHEDSSHMINEPDTENSKSYTEFLVKGKNVLSLFLVLMNQILTKENSYDIVSSFSFENCSILHSEKVINNEI